MASDHLVYGGFSAAVCCAASTLRGAEFVDDVNATAEGYSPGVVWDGLGLIDYNVAVHYKSEHSESEAIDREIAYYEQHDMRYITLRDGEALVLDGDQTEIVGQP